MLARLHPPSFHPAIPLQTLFLWGGLGSLSFSRSLSVSLVQSVLVPHPNQWPIVDLFLLLDMYKARRHRQHTDSTSGDEMREAL
uniref:Putative secreted protein n=1 Tax=Anopheles darlingi TaxID=43151 RepID=A0A2M4D5C1_ANODA